MPTKQITDTNTVTTLTNSHYIPAQVVGANTDKITYSNLSTQLLSLVQTNLPLGGMIIGGLEFQSSSLPPIIKAGRYDVNGTVFSLTADYLTAMTDALGSCSQTITAYNYRWMFNVIQKDTGNKYFLPALDGTALISGRVVTSVVVTGGNSARCYTADTSLLVVADGHNVCVMGSDAGLIIGPVTAISANTYFDVACTKASATYTGGTYDAYYRIRTSHLGGTDIITDASVTVYTPSPVFCTALNGYYLDQYGRPTSVAANAVYRIAGSWYVGAAGAVSHVPGGGYRSGKNKNDNEFDISCASNDKGSTNTNVIEWNGSVRRLWGNDYEHKKNTTDGDSIYTNFEMFLCGQLSVYNATNTLTFCKYESAITNSIVGGSEDIFQTSSDSNGYAELPTNKTIPKNRHIWVSTAGTIQTEGSTKTRWQGKFTL